MKSFLFLLLFDVKNGQWSKGMNDFLSRQEWNINQNFFSFLLLLCWFLKQNMKHEVKSLFLLEQCFSTFLGSRHSTTFCRYLEAPLDDQTGTKIKEFYYFTNWRHFRHHLTAPRLGTTILELQLAFIQTALFIWITLSAN